MLRAIKTIPSLSRPLSCWHSLPTVCMPISSLLWTAVPNPLILAHHHSFASIRSFSTSNDPPSNPKTGIRFLLRQYGTVALGTYMVLSFTVFCGCLTSITFLGIDETHIATAFNYVKSLVGIQPDSSIPLSDTDPAESKKMFESMTWLPEWARSPDMIRIVTNVLLAMAMTKLFTPFKIAITAATVPSIAKRIRSMNFSWVHNAIKSIRNYIRPSKN
ncbi:hypothetical protein BDV3_006722 [Batrachochytrium dendrobatidis]|nr:DUF1279 superfamily [Batrachochytrium dendrobatidis]OAJ42601.1 hypothetical protein BDEG_26042 [Batrachochytrium dendrobatidis JEL423]